MKTQGADINFSQVLQSTAVDQGCEKYDRILQSVLTGIGEEGAVSFDEAEENIHRMVRPATVYSFAKLVRTRGGAVVIAAGLLLVLLIGRTVPRDTLTGISDQDIPLAGSTVVQLTPSREYTVAPLVPITGNRADIPKLVGQGIEDGLLCIEFAPGAARILWDSVYAQEGDNAVEPVEIDPERDIICFALPEKSFTIYLEDADGNRSKAVVAVN